MNKNAIIVLHEIYGVNSFIESVCNELKSSFDVICPNMLNRKAFAYCEADKAYRYFQTEVGFEKSKDICAIGEYLKKATKKFLCWDLALVLRLHGNVAKIRYLMA